MAHQIRQVPISPSISTYLIAPLEPAVLCGGARLEDGLDVDGHVAVRAPEAAHDREAQAVLAALQLDNLRMRLAMSIFSVYTTILLVYNKSMKH